MIRTYSQSEGDADGDGIENDMDLCPYTPDPLWNPRAVCTGSPPSQPGDADCDGLPDTCDPDPNVANPDQDGDGYNNRQDICPAVANGCNTSFCHPTIFNPAWDNQSDTDWLVLSADLGPSPDSIGDACDGVEDGAVTPCSSADGIDNGGDTLIDGNDPDCIPFMDKGEVGECRNSTDDDGDTYVNDGCPQVGDYAESGDDCAKFDNVSDDTPTPDAKEQTLGVKVNDGCPVIGVPESSVIDAVISAPAAPSPFDRTARTVLCFTGKRWLVQAQHRLAWSYVGIAPKWRNGRRATFRA